MHADLNCPSCKSDATLRLSVVYENGISAVHTTSRSTGVGIGRGGLGFGVGRTQTAGTAQTAMSQKAAPPVKKRFLKPLGVIMLVTVIFSVMAGSNKAVGYLLTPLWFVASIAWVAYALRYNMTTWQQLKAAWNDSFICNRCNHMFRAQ